MALLNQQNADNKSKFGKGPGPFTEGMSWDSWAERFEFFIRLRGVTDPEMKKLLFFTEIGSIYEELRCMAQPDDVRTMNLADIMTLMADRYGETKSVAAKRHELFTARQQHGQNIRDFSIHLRTLIAKAEWGKDSIDMCLCALFINGLQNDSIRAELIKKGDQNMKFKDAVEIAVLLEQSDVDAHAIGSNSLKAEVAKVSVPKRGEQKQNTSRPCYRCGQTGHWANNCPNKNSTCNKCGKKGHWAVVCRSKAGSNQNPKSGDDKKKWGKSGNKQSIASVTEKQGNVHEISVPPSFVELEVHKGRVKFELDSGAGVSLINVKDWKRIGKPKIEPGQGLLAYGDVPIEGVLGQAEVEVAYLGNKSTTQMYVIDGQRRNLCGRDLISNLKIDLNHAFGIGSIQQKSSKQDLEKILQQYPEVFRDGLGRCTKRVSLKFKEGVQPRRCKPRPVPFALKPEVGKVLDNWQAEGVIEPVATSDWATPLVIVPKPNGKLRLCCDYKVTVNQWLDIHQYPLPRPDDLFSVLNGGQKFSKLDLKDAYLQLMLDDQAKKCLTICTHKGLFQFKRLPFGVASAPAIFQQIMEEILQGIEGVGVYLDDILVTGATDEEHLNRISQVLQRLSLNGLRVKMDKCELLREKIEYLGHVIDKNGIHTSPEKIEAIRKMPAPKNLKELQSFLGMVNYYGKFVPAMATVSEPLNELRRTGVAWQWGSEQQEAFNRIKELLSSTQLLVHYDPGKPLFLATDASDYGIGAVLFHKDPETGKVGVIAYASKTLNPAERNYAQIEKEGRSIIFGVDKFNQYLYGRKFVLQTDHEPLKKIFGPKGELPIVAARRLHRWSLILMNYDYDIEYCPTKEFGYADGLSRLPAPEMEKIDLVCREVRAVQADNLSSLPIMAETIAEETSRDPILKTVKKFIGEGWQQKCPEEQFKPFHVVRNELEVVEGCIVFGARTVIPGKFRAKMLELVHATHSGIVRMKALARQKIWWPGIDKDIEMMRKSCKICQTDSPEERKVPLHPWETPNESWQRLHIDYCGPFWGSMWLVIVDAKSKWPEVVKMKSTSSEATIEALRIVFGTHGLPQQIVSDNGPQFTSKEFEDYCKSRGIVHTLIAPYNPKSNGLAERFVQTFKQGMRKMQEDGMKLDLALSQFLLKYRVTPHPATEKSPSELLFNRKLRTLLDLVNPKTKVKRSEGDKEKTGYEKRAKRHFDKRTKEKTLEIGQPIFARNFRDGPKWLQGRIIQKIGNAMFLVRTSRGLWRRHLDQLKPDLTGQDREESDSEEEGSDQGENQEVDQEEFHPADEQEQHPPEVIDSPVPVLPPQGANPPQLRRSERNRKPKKIFEPE